MNRRVAIVVVALLAALQAAAPALAGAPTLPASNQAITLDGTPLGSAIAFRSSAATILFDSASSRFQMWVQVADELDPGTTASDFYPLRIAGFRHATSVDGVHFTSDGAMSFAGSPFASTIYGATFGEPAWIYPKASVWNGHYVLGLWTFNDYFAPGVFGDYNYNISLNDIGSNPGNLSITHMGPVGPVPANAIYGQTAGIYGIVNGVMYYDNNSLLGRAALTDNGAQTFPGAANTGPWQVTASNSAVADLITPLGFSSCGGASPTAYVHNDARVIDNGDGTLGLFYTLRNCDGSRMIPGHIYYAESADDGVTWGTPTSISVGTELIGGNAATTGFALTDVVTARGQRVVYFNYTDSAGNLVVGAAPPPVPPPVQAGVPVDVDAPWMLALLVGTLLLGGAYDLRRRGHSARR